MKKWREFLEGGNDIRFFLKKGNHPPSSRAGRAEQKEGRKEYHRRKSRAGRADGTFEEINSKKKESRSRSRAEQTAEQGAGRKQKAERKQKESRKLRFATFIFHWKLFPSFATVRIKYQSKNNNINLCVFNILYE